MQLETPLPTVQAAAELAAQAGVRLILNPAPAQALPDALLQRVSILTPNETEAELLTGVAVTDEAAANMAADKLLARGVQTVILTLGARGALVVNAETRQLIPGFAVKAVDTVAAGDVFNGRWRLPWPKASRCSRPCGSPTPPPPSRSPASAHNRPHPSVTKSINSQTHSARCS